MTITEEGTYALAYEATDECGNKTTAYSVVHVLASEQMNSESSE